MENNMRSTNLRNTFMMAVVFAVSFVLIVMRRPDIVFNAQPWAEDGVVWINFIHNNGFLSTIFEPQNGYYQTISKLVFGFALQFGLANAPLVANACAIALRCFMVMFLLSSRFKSINVWYRLAMSAYFIMMPNVDEGYVNITNAHWYLSVYLMMVLIAEDPKSTAGVMHDYLVLFISALSGPFIVFVAPCIAIKRIYERGGVLKAIKGINTFDIIAALLTLIQVIAILSTFSSSRTPAPLGASFPLLSDIINYRIVVGTLFDNSKTLFFSVLTAVNILGFVILSALLIYVFIKGDKSTRICMLFPVIMIGFSLAKPMMADNSDQWPIFLIPGAGQRYFIITNIFFFALILYVMHKITKGSSAAAIIFTLAISPLYASYFSIYPLKDMHYREQISNYERLGEGQSIIININPGWSFNLIKK